MTAKTKLLLFEKQAELAKALAHPLRIAIVNSLRNGERCVCEIAEHVDSERSNVSRHLAIMTGAGLLECRKEGLNVFYSLKAPCILDFFACVTRVLKQKAKENERLLAAL